MSQPSHRVAGFLLLVLTGSAAGGDGGALPVSPGAPERAAELASSCPTFSWSAVPGATGYRLALFEIGEDGSAEPHFTERIEGAAFSWTPARERCLVPGREYAWVVAAERGEAAALDPWSVPLRFRVPGVPSAEEVRGALELLERWRAAEAEAPAAATGGAAGELDVSVAPGRAREARREAPLAQGAAAIRGEMTDSAGSVHGVFGVTHSAQGAGVVARNESGGPDLVLDGEAQGLADTLLSESGIDRPSAAAQSFGVRNSGAGTMTLQVDGQEVVTVLTDRDTLAALSCGAGQLAKWIGGIWSCADDAGETYLAGNQLELSGTTFDVVEGPGSGLDADLLDGLQGAAFALSGHVHAGEQITTGTVAEPRIAAALARDAEIVPAVLAGDGSGSTLDADFLDGVDSTSFQARVTGVCSAGQAMQGVNADGSVVCYEVPVPPRVTTVDDPANSVGRYTSLAIGADGLPVISYYDDTAQSLQVAKCNDAACAGGDQTITAVDDSFDVVGWDTSLAIGADGLPVIAYYDDTAQSLKVAKCNDAACAGGDETITTVDDPGNSVGRYTSLAIGADGLPVISYHDDTFKSLKVAKCNDAACAGGDETITTVDDPGNWVGRYTSLAIGADGLPVISYTDYSLFLLKVAKCNDAACAGGDETITTVDDPANSVGLYTSLAVGADGLPVISYRDNTAGSLKVAKCNDAACAGGNETITTVDDPANSVGFYTSLAIGADGLPVISYRDNTAGSLKVAKCNDAACAGGDETITTVDDSANSVGNYTSLAVSADGLPVVSYRDDTVGSLKVAKCRNPSCRN